MIFNLRTPQPKLIFCAIFISLQSLTTFGASDILDQTASAVQWGGVNSSAAGFYTYATETKTNSDVVNLKNKTESLKLHSYGFKGSHNDKNSLSALNSIADLYDSEQGSVVGDALVYPNPFRQTTGGTLGYDLSKHMDIEIQIYDMTANLIYKNTFEAGADGGKGDSYNKLRLDSTTFDGYELSAGVYFYYIINNGDVLAKGKMAVIP